MALKIRLQRHGASHHPFYRMVVTEAAARRDGRFVEIVGTYEPQAKRAEEELKLKLDRIDHWTSVGAKPTDTAASLIRKARRETPADSASLASSATSPTAAAAGDATEGAAPDQAATAASGT